MWREREREGGRQARPGLLLINTIGLPFGRQQHPSLNPLHNSNFKFYQ